MSFTKRFDEISPLIWSCDVYWAEYQYSLAEQIMITMCNKKLEKNYFSVSTMCKYYKISTVKKLIVWNPSHMPTLVKDDDHPIL